MAWTAPRTWIPGAILAAAQLNTDIRDNLSYLKGLLDGTGGATAVTVPDRLAIHNDAAYYLDVVSSDPRMIYDTNDYLWYLRSTNVWTVVIGGTSVLTVDGNGKLAGAGFYSSGEQAITAGNTITVNHGLAARPRFVGGFFINSSGVENAKTSPILVSYDNGWTNAVIITSVTSTQISIKNALGVTEYAHVYAQL
jgi:hypothetical protein